MQPFVCNALSLAKVVVDVSRGWELDVILWGPHPYQISQQSGPYLSYLTVDSSVGQTDRPTNWTLNTDDLRHKKGCEI